MKKFQGIKRFKPLFKISIREFFSLVKANFFDESVNIFGFYNRFVEVTESTKPLFEDYLDFANSYQNYNDLEKLILSDFDASSV